MYVFQRSRKDVVQYDFGILEETLDNGNLRFRCLDVIVDEECRVKPIPGKFVETTFITDAEHNVLPESFRDARTGKVRATASMFASYYTVFPYNEEDEYIDDNRVRTRQLLLGMGKTVPSGADPRQLMENNSGGIAAMMMKF